MTLRAQSIFSRSRTRRDFGRSSKLCSQAPNQNKNELPKSLASMNELRFVLESHRPSETARCRMGFHAWALRPLPSRREQRLGTCEEPPNWQQGPTRTNPIWHGARETLSRNVFPADRGPFQSVGILHCGQSSTCHRIFNNSHCSDRPFSRIAYIVVTFLIHTYSSPSPYTADAAYL